MTIETIADIINVSVPVGLVVVGVWFGLAELWPWWKERDTENRQREYERELAQIEAGNTSSSALASLASSQTAVALAMTALSDAVSGCPLKTEQ